ncbi:MAG: serine/threonine protein kinase, partial [Planctomycetes bacterium]|nr:serine/threonine protein kinase [Planctomycetota bacterium]
MESYVEWIYVEADAQHTELRLVKELQKTLAQDLGQFELPQILSHLRAGKWLPARKKLLIVFDHFEQWLQATKDYADSQLVKALRQCDGARVQCMVLIRDDFWMAATRFFQSLEEEIVDGRNAAVVDRFDLRHAKKVLQLFGQAYEALPANPGDFTPEQAEFLQESVDLLAEDERVVSVRLAVFADMLKAKEWVPATLRNAGGAEGIGVRFLDDSLDSKRGPARYRPHAAAAERLLKCLLPDVGSDIKGHMRSQTELLAATGYGNRQDRFQELLKILESELRLITRTEPLGAAEGTESDDGEESYYQLTHDFLVPSLRQWLTAKQSGTWRGRAEIRLEERASLWDLCREPRQLPTLWETIHIMAATTRSTWSAKQAAVMRQATRVHGVRLAVGVMLIAIAIAATIALRDWAERAARTRRAESLVAQLLKADISRVPEVLNEMTATRDIWAEGLRDVAQNAAYSHAEQLRAKLALARQDASDVPKIIGVILSEDPDTIRIVRQELAPFATRVTGDAWKIALDPSLEPSQ